MSKWQNYNKTVDVRKLKPVQGDYSKYTLSLKKLTLGELLVIRNALEHYNKAGSPVSGDVFCKVRGPISEAEQEHDRM